MPRRWLTSCIVKATPSCRPLVEERYERASLRGEIPRLQTGKARIESGPSRSMIHVLVDLWLTRVHHATTEFSLRIDPPGRVFNTGMVAPGSPAGLGGHA
jgi:hypothetical protein